MAAVHIQATVTKYYTVDMKPGQAAHQRNELEPVFISAMHRSGLVGNATMQQVQVVCDLTCVDINLG